MKAQHLIGVVVLLAIGYGLGVFFPGLGQKVKSMVSGG